MSHFHYSVVTQAIDIDDGQLVYQNTGNISKLN